MPTYDYRCKGCGHEFELFQSMSAKPERTCPKCGRKTLERLIGTGAALLFKGSGFYQTDYRSESYRKAADADKPASSGGDAKPAETKTSDAKPAEPKADSKGAADKSGASKDSGGTGSAAKSAPAPTPAREAKGGKSDSKSGGKPSKKK